jgi:hypothetical protein
MGMEALAHGTAGWGDEGCMVIRMGDETYLIVFPHGTRLEENDEVVLPDGFRITGGDDVALGGGLLSAAEVKGRLAESPEECLTEHVIVASGEHQSESAG